MAHLAYLTVKGALRLVCDACTRGISMHGLSHRAEPTQLTDSFTGVYMAANEALCGAQALFAAIASGVVAAFVIWTHRRGKHQVFSESSPVAAVIVLLFALSVILDCLARAVAAGQYASFYQSGGVDSLTADDRRALYNSTHISRALLLMSACFLVALVIMRRGFLLIPGPNPVTFWPAVCATLSCAVGAVSFAMYVTYAVLFADGTTAPWPYSGCGSNSCFPSIPGPTLESAIGAALGLDACSYPYVTPLDTLIALMFAVVAVVVAPFCIAPSCTRCLGPRSTADEPGTAEHDAIPPLSQSLLPTGSHDDRKWSSITATMLLLSCEAFAISQILALVPVAALGTVGFGCIHPPTVSDVVRALASTNAAAVVFTSLPATCLCTAAVAHLAAHAVESA